METRWLSSILILCILFAFAVPVAGADESTDLYNQAVLIVHGGGDLQKAITLVDQALAINSSHFDGRSLALELKSYAQIQLGNYNGALSTLDSALAIEETDILWNNKGFVLYELGRYTEAVQAYDTALKIRPDYTVALINKGDALMKLARYQDAIDAYSKAFALDAPLNDLSQTQKAKTFKDMGDAFSNIGKYQDAISAYQSALANDPANADAAAGLARARQQADTGPMLMIIAVIGIVLAGGAAAYYIRKKKTVISGKEKS